MKSFVNFVVVADCCQLPANPVRTATMAVTWASRMDPCTPFCFASTVLARGTSRVTSHHVIAHLQRPGYAERLSAKRLSKSQVATLAG
jgi:hypothetical protein